MERPHPLQAPGVDDERDHRRRPAVDSDADASDEFVPEKRMETLLTELQLLKEKIRVANIDSVPRRIMSLMEQLKALEKQADDSQAECTAYLAELESQMTDLEKMLKHDYDGDDLQECLDCLQRIGYYIEGIFSVKRQLDDAPALLELIQYEWRFSELNANTEDKHRETRKYYSTYNVLLEIKELMLKEISLLDSLNLQFQEAIASTDGRGKLLISMEGILKGVQQKLSKIQAGYQSDQEICNTLRKKYAAAAADQRKQFTLLKVLQEEVARNRKLKGELQLRSSTEES
ncbi:hypothetical protein MLD38_014635 [Melastoma candidum]|uniref:Uncharacterized protein n=1 Tax=Melastoma candidum TaxID=119954 RepID=A0ACB9RDD6_9MYRT|nr:hypothetical protein MLD38_014635 [Melastoma candidum]